MSLNPPLHTLRASLGILLFFSSLRAVGPLDAQPLNPQEAGGRKIYRLGESPRGTDITVVVGEQGLEVPAAALPCASCHGRDGRGRPEGGVNPAEVTWEELRRPLGPSHPGGRTRPAYTEGTLKRAITLGLDPAGNPLHVAMPRYRMSQEDMADLVAYLKVLARDLDPGVTEEGLRIGTLVPPRRQWAGLADSIEGILRGYFAEINQDGGVYGRRLELQVRELPEEAFRWRGVMDRFLQEEEIFALVAPFASGAEADLTSAAEAAGVPVVGPFTSAPVVGPILPRQVFYLFSGLREQGLALAEFAGRAWGSKELRVAILHHPGTDFATAARAVEERCREVGWPGVTRREISPGDPLGSLVARLGTEGVEVVFVFALGEELGEFLRAASGLGWTPAVLAPGVLVDPGTLDLARSFAGRLFLAFPALPRDLTSQALAVQERLVRERNLPSRHSGIQRSTLAAARLFVEGLKRAGRELSREGLVSALESLDGFVTGFAPPLRYGPNRRIGAYGAYVVEVDGTRDRLLPAENWILPP